MKASLAAPVVVSGSRSGDEQEALRSLTVLSDALYERLDVRSLGRRALDAVLQFTGVPAAVVYQLDRSGRRLERMAAQGVPPALLRHWRVLPREHSLTGQAVDRRSILEVLDLEADAHMEPDVRRALLAAGLHAAVCVPLQWRARVVGAINLFLARPRRLTGVEAETLLAMGRTVALALVNARQVDRLRAAHAQLRAAHDQLEVRVAERTRELTDANAQLVAQVAARVRAERALRTSQERYRRQSITDALTGLHNVRHFHARLADAAGQARDTGAPLCLLLLDVDHFKGFNDRHGHLEGDRALAHVGRLLRSSRRGQDQAFRYGGEEFTVLLPGTTRSQAARVAERIRAGLARRPFRLVSGLSVLLTVSVGVAALAPGMETVELVRRADAAMYRAKQGGRNRVEVDG